MSTASATGLEPFTIELSASDLPQRLLDRFPVPPPADARFTVTIEPAESDAEKLRSLKRDVAAGVDDLTAGRTSDSEAVFARLKRRFPAS